MKEKEDKARKIEKKAEKEKFKEYESLVDVELDRKKMKILAKPIKKQEEVEVKVEEPIEEDLSKFMKKANQIKEVKKEEKTTIQEEQNKKTETIKNTALSQEFALIYYNPVNEDVETVNETYEIIFDTPEQKVIEEVKAAEEIQNVEIKDDKYVLEDLNKGEDEKKVNETLEEIKRKKEDKKKIEEQNNQLKDYLKENEKTINKVIEEQKRIVEESIKREVKREKLLEEVNMQRKNILRAIDKIRKDKKEKVKKKIKEILKLLPPLTRKRLELLLRKTKKLEIILLFLVNELKLLNEIEGRIKVLDELPDNLDELIEKILEQES